MSLIQCVVIVFRQFFLFGGIEGRGGCRGLEGKHRGIKRAVEHCGTGALVVYGAKIRIGIQTHSAAAGRVVGGAAASQLSGLPA